MPQSPMLPGTRVSLEMQRILAEQILPITAGNHTALMSHGERRTHRIQTPSG